MGQIYLSANRASFVRDGELIATVTGRDVLRLIAARGQPSSKLPSCYVNIHFGADTFTRIEFRTSIPAFESDNHAFAKVVISEADAL